MSRLRSLKRPSPRTLIEHFEKLQLDKKDSLEDVKVEVFEKIITLTVRLPTVAETVRPNSNHSSVPTVAAAVRPFALFDRSASIQTCERSSSLIKRSSFCTIRPFGQYSSLRAFVLFDQAFVLCRSSFPNVTVAVRPKCSTVRSYLLLLWPLVQTVTVRPFHCAPVRSCFVLMNVRSCFVLVNVRFSFIGYLNVRSLLLFAFGLYQILPPYTTGSMGSNTLAASWAAPYSWPGWKGPSSFSPCHTLNPKASTGVGYRRHIPSGYHSAIYACHPNLQSVGLAANTIILIHLHTPYFTRSPPCPSGPWPENQKEGMKVDIRQLKEQMSLILEALNALQ
ncbi:hypothetical protein LR48_Vigan03g013100 [Vigna angularis]|uniref:Uncharacterized protein n=1 Tax=Phaseolus angularis TaxID=3914 RepID=A0A0L9U1U1_PHAAN|nr:hypothetical protein LR48_Vigan03g013100 [Vigna angularis]